MNGPEHYAEAERLLEVANERVPGYHPAPPGSDGTESRWTPLGKQLLLSEAHVHATLALAAATAGPRVPEYERLEDAR